MIDSSLLKYLSQIKDRSAEPAILVLVVDTQASAPQVPGARMLVSRAGIVYGTVGGGTIEKLAVDHATAMLKQGARVDFKTYDMSHSPDDRIATGMLCGGTISLYFESLTSSERLIIYGCGHIGTILGPMAARSGFQVLAIDNRPEIIADSSRFAGVDPGDFSVQCAPPVEHAASLTFGASDSIVIMTHNHQFDAAVLTALTSRMTENTMPRYLGMIGSASKVRTVLERLKSEDVSESVLAKVRTPIGLKIGGDSPADIAISILSEIIAAKHGKIESGCVRTMSGR